MPLESGPVGSPAFKENIKTELASGKERSQALAIAYSKARGDETKPHEAALSDNLGVPVEMLSEAIAAADAMFALADSVAQMHYKVKE